MCFGGAPTVVKSTGPRTSPLGPMRILVFGNGLALGEAANTKPHFVGHRLHEMLQAQFPGRYIEILNRGKSKEKVSFTMNDRLKKTLKAAADSDIRYDWIIIAAGTDDVLAEIESEYIKSSLESIYGLAYSHGAVTIAITIPENPSESKKQAQIRAEVNGRIPQLSTSSRSRFIDFHASCPKGSQFIPPQSAFPTPAGYDKLAEAIFEQMKDLDFGDRPRGANNQTLTKRGTQIGLQTDAAAAPNQPDLPAQADAPSSLSSSSSPSASASASASGPGGAPAAAHSNTSNGTPGDIPLKDLNQ